MSDPSITCPVCEMTSHHPKDVEHGYCGNCHDYTGKPDGCVRAFLRASISGGEPEPSRVLELVVAWARERRPREPMIRWLRRMADAGTIQA